MGIYLRENGIYYLKTKVEGKYKRISLETSDRNIAQEIYNAYLLDKIKSKLISNRHKEQGSSINNNPVCLTVSKTHLSKIKPLYLEYMESCQVKNLAPATMWYEETLLDELLSNGIIYLEDITQQSINKLVQFWMKEKPSCISKQTANLKVFLNHCIKSQKFNSSIYYSITFPSTSNTGVRETVISESDYQRLIKYITDNDFKLYLQTLWETGCRPNEIVGLKKEDIDFMKGTAKIYQYKTKKYKTVYFTNELLKIYQKLAKKHIFNGVDKQKEYYAKKFKDIREKLNLNKEYCLYAFRHTFGTRILNKTKDIHLVSKLLGHSDIGITAKHYINRSDDEIREKLIQLQK